MKIEVRNGQAIIEGYVNVTERMSKPIRDIRGTFIEKVEKGTFTRALEQNNNVELKFNHKRKLGDQHDGTLELREDEVGLYAKATVNDAEVVKKAETRQLKGWSFGFSEIKSEWNKEGDSEIRSLKDILLKEVSILDIQPAYAATTISVRANQEELLEHRAEGESNIEYDIEERSESPDKETKKEFNKEFEEIVKKLQG